MQRYPQIISFFILWLLVLSVHAQDDEAVILNRKISLDAQHMKLDEVLDEISKLAEINFSYDPTLLDLDDLISVTYVNRNLSYILTDLLGSEFRFQQLGNQLIINLNEKRTKDDSQPEGNYRIINGQIQDREDHGAIPYASISILDKAFGTISNSDGHFELKIPPRYQHEQLVFSCMGYERQVCGLDSLAGDTLVISLKPFNIRLKEIKVRAINPVWVLEQMLAHVPDNYPGESHLMTAFYREVLTQNGVFINVSEAVIQLLKASYTAPMSEDKIRFLKGRKSPNVEPFQWVDFKMKGGPYYTTQLDVVKTMDTFLDENYRSDYKYETGPMIDYLGRPTYVVQFSPVGRVDFLTYEGRLFIDQETFALVHAGFSLSRNGIRLARQQLIRKKPKGFNVRALSLDYQVSYQLNNGRWFLNTARSSVRFRVRSRHDQVNAVFHSVSDLLITRDEPTRLKRFPKDEQIHSFDIFTEMITDYDPLFWGNYNIIQPTDDLKKAIRTMVSEKALNNKPTQ